MAKNLKRPGVHTDGLEAGFLMNLERDNISGAVNGFHTGLNTDSDILSTTLMPGEGVHWKDNEIYHSVQGCVCCAVALSR